MRPKSNIRWLVERFHKLAWNRSKDALLFAMGLWLEQDAKGYPESRRKILDDAGKALIAAAEKWNDPALRSPAVRTHAEQYHPTATYLKLPDTHCEETQ